MLVEHLLVAEHATERRLPGQGDGHEELRVEPETDLLAHLRHPVRREPALPGRVVRQVSGGEPLRRTRRVPLRYVRVVVPPECRERDDAGIEPDVPHLLDAVHLRTACGAGDRHGVDPRPAQLLELLEPRQRTRLELGTRADHVHVPAGARVDRQRQPVVAAAGDVPVPHVAQPVVHALAHVGGRPLDGRVRVEQGLADLVDRDEPVVREPEDQRRMAPPAERITVLVRLCPDEQRTVGEVAHDLLGRLRRREAVQPAVVGIEATALVDGRERRQIVHLGELEVLAAATRGDVDDAGARVESNVVPRNHAMLDLGAGRERVERTAVAQPHELGSLHGPREALVRKQCHANPFTVFEQPVLRLGIDGRGDVRGQRPRRRRPDHDPFAVTVEQREADVQRRVDPVLVVPVQLVRRDRGAAARTPFRGPVALRQPALLVHDRQEAPDVLDVRVGERVVVVAPVHPLAEPDRPLRQLL